MSGLVAPTHVNPIQLLIIVATINGLIAAPFLILAMLISGDRRLMGTYAMAPRIDPWLADGGRHGRSR
jgi:Mn2+/Fe2+ NRAMP family transporter